MLASLRSPEGDEGAISPERRATRPGLAGRKPVDDGSEPLILPGGADAKAPDPQVLPGSTGGKEAEPLVLPGTVDAKPPEPQVLPAAPAKEAEPLVLPGTVVAKEPEPQVLPGTAAGKDPQPQVLPGTVTGKGPEPLVLPDGLTAKGVGPQVLPGAADGKAPGPQVLPGLDTVEGATPTPDHGDAMEVAATGVTRTAAGPAQTHPLQPLPPMRALAERTSRPLEETRSALSPTSGEVKATSPAISPPAVTADQAAKPAPHAAPTQAAPQADSSATLPDEGRSTAGGPTAGQAEASAPVRDHSLSTLSRATIDATAQIAAQIQRRLEGRSTRFEITLKPAELGRVDVKLDVDAEGRLAARLAFDNPAAATDLRGRADELRRQLEAAGFQLADDAFEFAERDSGSSAFDRGQDARDGQNRAFAAAARLKTEIDVAQPPQWLALSLSPSGVDMKV
ncbi:flagellar hook-length control protein FliK [Roseibacterium beibuensis]|uniref:flagellar hook-length control protein FliK n=1 Tax=[Roseibacterium] beibuensis TaxID=1193142 RepID=UPI00217E8960|nr:flagellar hook-length control protein FliK [Roseibacterium beibuensis]MCS6622679.1 flagellar hook-length control protein FliK [Roseibacterium beibuensis]